jgi:tetratricopeptide (TPR) repeat protein
MKNMNNPSKPALSAVIIVFALVMNGATEPYVINSAGTKVTGVAIRSESDGAIILTTRNGQELRFQHGTYKQAVADPPPEMTKVQTRVRLGELSSAAELLRQIKTQYQHLGWDQHAGRMLARVELARKQFEAAAVEYEMLFAVQPQLKDVLAERSRYMQALVGIGRMEKVAEMIDEDIASGSREAAARAQIVRGDMKAASGQLEEALLDYLRTVLLFKEQEEVLPEATYKTATTLRRMNDPRAEIYFEKLMTKFPSSEFAKRAQGENQ